MKVSMIPLYPVLLALLAGAQPATAQVAQEFNVPPDADPGFLGPGDKLNLTVFKGMPGILNDGFLCGPGDQSKGGLGYAITNIRRDPNLIEVPFAGSNFNILEDGIVNMAGGAMGESLNVLHGGCLYLSDGTVARNGAQFDETGSGGPVAKTLVQMIDGELGLDGDQSHPSFSVGDGAEFHCCGGEVGPYFTIDGTSNMVSGPTAEVNISGGIWGHSIRAMNGRVTIYAQQSTLGEMGNGFGLISDRNETLSGILANGDPFSFFLGTTLTPGQDFFAQVSDDLGSGVILTVIHATAAPYEIAELDSLSTIRGIVFDGDIADASASDDSYLIYNPGFTINGTEAPVWVNFDGTLSDPDPTFLYFSIESNAGTPGLTRTIEMMDWETGQYVELDFAPASFNADTVDRVNLSAYKCEFIQEGTGNVRARVGWRQTGFVINFPWEVRIDNVQWDLRDCDFDVGI